MVEYQIQYNCNNCGNDITANRIGNYIKCNGCGNCGDLASTAIMNRLEQVVQPELPSSGRGQKPEHQRSSQPFIVPGTQVGDPRYYDDYEQGNLT